MEFLILLQPQQLYHKECVFKLYFKEYIYFCCIDSIQIGRLGDLLLNSYYNRKTKIDSEINFFNRVLLFFGSCCLIVLIAILLKSVTVRTLHMLYQMFSYQYQSDHKLSIMPFILMLGQIKGSASTYLILIVFTFMLHMCLLTALCDANIVAGCKIQANPNMHKFHENVCIAKISTFTVYDVAQTTIHIYCTFQVSR